MLTVHNYKNLNKDWDKNKILDCCKTNTDDDPCGDCCYDTWSDEAKQVSKKLAAQKEIVDQLQKHLEFYTARRNKFKTWKEELETANKLAKDICRQLELIAEHSNKIWANSFLAVKAIQTLFCMIRDFFVQLDYIKKRYEVLQECITKNTDPSLVKGQGILLYLEDYAKKLDIVIKMRDDIIKAAVDTVRLGNLLRNNMSTREWPYEYIPCKTKYDPCCDDQPACPSPHSHHPHYGFKTVICEWYYFFNCDKSCDCDDSNTTATPNHNQQVSLSNTSGKGGHTTDQNSFCDESCELETFSFPICNNDYKNCITKRYNEDDATVKEVEKQLEKAIKSKEALQACKNSLDAAIKEVSPTDRCK